MPSTFPIIISPNGRFANIMFQHMLAVQLQRRLGAGAVIYGPGMPEWGWPAAEPPVSPANPRTIGGQLFDLDELAYCLRSGAFDAILIKGWGMRLEYFPHVDEFRAMFRSDVVGQRIADDEMLISVRAEDIESGWHPAYYPLPFDFYEAVIRAENKRPVFIGQLEPGPYVNALRQRFPHARYLPLATPMEDFQTLRGAGCVVPSISSFAWLATWLSESVHTIHLPVAGLFDPRLGQHNLMPLGDERYRFWSVDFPTIRERGGLEAATWAAAPRQAHLRNRDWVLKVARESITTRIPVG